MHASLFNIHKKSTIYISLQVELELYSSVIKEKLKWNQMCMVLFVKFYIVLSLFAIFNSTSWEARDLASHIGYLTHLPIYSLTQLLS